LVAGFHTEYSGFRWALYFLAEYANMFVVSSVAVTLFWGGWLRPFPSVASLELPLNAGFPLLLFAGSGLLSFRLAARLKLPLQRLGLMAVAALLILIGALFLIAPVRDAVAPLFWFFFKVALILYTLIWFRGTFPRFRYDQLMNIGWKWLIPIGIGSIVVNGVVGMLRIS
jgi:NADH-quinone oxidoreductase subunit H